MKMLPLVALITCSNLQHGCALSGYYKLPKAERASPEEAANVTFPDSMDQGTHLDGPALAALEVAMNDFLPPDAKAEARTEELARCLSQRSTYDVTVLKHDDQLYFVSFLPRLSRCGIELDAPIMDAGATYAIDGHGRILSER
ncbi:hypothetical protein QEG98_02710 [Myxococcus sp. MxC21-1]|uniref:hypothetical protein n=1 Tax=Myxococcus sp. MxC21-1 TaxID=3041439 RepID=UPI00292EEFE6|nr:hypothetical protein [Myxococcus sp. MxC21-1]WNZ62747.1 hypothetical protein QEG98_02710 [Myxococcus sp. MxC21-1]